MFKIFLTANDAVKNQRRHSTLASGLPDDRKRETNLNCILFLNCEMSSHAQFGEKSMLQLQDRHALC